MNVGPDTVLGHRYKLTERIAGGGMGEVWKATDEVLGRTVAVKILLPALLAEPGFAERFRGEARTMATISHPGVVNIYDYSSDQTVAYLVMEYIEGDPLSKTLAKVGRLTPKRTMALIAQAADALHAAHVKGIVHRDVKPGNLLVRPNGTLVLTDFGIARSSAITSQLTAVGSVLGTASYISPEQASGGVATALSDVYGLGVVAYQCLSGRRPFEGNNPVDIAMRHVRDQPPPLPDDTPPAVRAIVGRALAKNPGARWPSAAAFAEACRGVAATLTGNPAPARSSPQQAVHPAAHQAAHQARPPVAGGPGGYPARPPLPGYPGQPAPAGYSGAPGGPGGPGGPYPGGPGSPGGPARGAGPAPMGPYGSPAGYPQPRTPQPTGAPYRAARRRMSGWMIIAIVAAVVTVICLIWSQVPDKSSGGPTRSPTRTSRASGGAVGYATVRAEPTRLDCSALRKKTPVQAQAALRAAGFQPYVEEVSGKRGKIVDIVPCQGRPGDVITIQVGNGTEGRAAGLPAGPECGNPIGFSCVTPTGRH